jgi:hypothetical protein
MKHQSPCSGPLDTSAFTRRQLLHRLGMGMGGMALTQLMGSDAMASVGLKNLPHFAPKAKRVIFLFMSGGVSQLDSFDHKPELKKNTGNELPASLRGGKDKFLPGMAGHQSHFYLAGSPYEFKQYGESGAWVSDRWPETAKVVDDITFIKSMTSDAVNHDPAMIFMNSGSQLPGRPSMGSWLSYGLGSMNENLPAFITLISKYPVDQPLSCRLWDSGFLPSQYQGVQFRAAHDPVLYLSAPPGTSLDDSRRVIDTLKELQHASKVEDQIESEVAGRIEQYEMAFRMQTSVPEVTDVSKEPDSVFNLYGPKSREAGSLEANCILARRLAQQGVRFIQLYHPGWDHHGRLPDLYPSQALSVDRACASLITDLKNHGMLDDTLVVWGTEFGRTPFSQGNLSKTGSFGRDHHRNCFTFWMAGAGVKKGFTHGVTDELGYQVAQDPVTVNDLHATMLHLMGIDHERFTYRFQGRDFRLTDVAGKVVKQILT